MPDEIKMLAARIRELREISGCSVAELAQELNISEETYESYEQDGVNIPISVLYHISNKFQVDLTEILTGTPARLDDFAVVRRGEGKKTDRYPGYSFKALAFKFKHKIMEPLLVTCDPEDGEPKLVTHGGQEFNYILEGQIEFIFEDRRIVMSQGDSVYFNPAHLHGQRCYGDKPAKFLTVIAE